MVQELKDKPKALYKTKFLRLVVWIIVIIILAFVANKLWSRYDGQHLFVTKQISYLENKISQLSQGLSSDASEVKSLDEKSVTDLQLRDAYFMVRIAATILQNDHDIAAAIELLNAAQEHLNNLQGEKIDQAKALLAADIEKLSAVQVTDTSSVQDQLALLDKLAVNLPLKHEIVETFNHDDTATKSAASKEADQSRWQQSIQNMLAEAKTVVRVRKKPSGEALSGVTIEIKRAQFRLLMEQIRWALFYKDSEVYKTSIFKMQQLLPEIFEVNNDIVKEFSSILAEMSKVQINVDVPNIQESVNALKALLVG